MRGHSQDVYSLVSGLEYWPGLVLNVDWLTVSAERISPSIQQLELPERATANCSNRQAHCPRLSPDPPKKFTIDMSTDSEEAFPATMIRHLYTQFTLTGRRITVYVARAPGLTVNSNSKKIVIKVSQQYIGRQSDAGTLQLAQILGLQHVAELRKAKDLFHSSDVVRTGLGVEFDDRIVRAIAMPLYATLSSTLDREPVLLKKMAGQMIECESLYHISSCYII